MLHPYTTRSHKGPFFIGCELGISNAIRVPADGQISAANWRSPARQPPICGWRNPLSCRTAGAAVVLPRHCFFACARPSYDLPPAQIQPHHISTTHTECFRQHFVAQLGPDLYLPSRLRLSGLLFPDWLSLSRDFTLVITKRRLRSSLPGMYYLR